METENTTHMDQLTPKFSKAEVRILCFEFSQFVLDNIMKSEVLPDYDKWFKEKRLK